MTTATYRRLLLFILGLILALNTADRLGLGLMLQDIKRSLNLSDTQLGVLTGIAFALFYATMGIPIARWTDRGNRVSIIVLTTLLWSVAMCLSGMAASFAQLLLIRVGVAVGEAGCIPPAHSLIPDYFKREERARAVALYMLGASVGTVGGYFAVGWLNAIYGWRATFVAIGLPGFPLALAALAILREPRRMRAFAAERPTVPSAREVLAHLARNTTFRNLVLFFSLLAFFGNGITQWQPAFLMRSFGVTSSKLGTWFSLFYGIGGAIGIYGGGALASRFAGGNESLQLRLIAASYCALAMLQALIYLTGHLATAMMLIGLTAVGSGLVMGPLFGTVQTLVPPPMRAMSIALIYLASNLIGLGFGPLAVGVISDALSRHYGNESLRLALLALSPGYFLVAWFLFRASRTVVRDLSRPEQSTTQVLQGEICDSAA